MPFAESLFPALLSSICLCCRPWLCRRGRYLLHPALRKDLPDLFGQHFFAGFIAGLFGLILLGHITSWMQSKKRAKYREFKMGDDLFDVEIPNFLPHDEEDKD